MTTIGCPQCAGTGKYQERWCDLCDNKGSIDRDLWVGLGYPVRAVERKQGFDDYVVSTKVTIFEPPNDPILIIQTDSTVQYDGVFMFTLGVNIQQITTPVEINLDDIVTTELAQIDELLGKGGMMQFTDDLMMRLSFAQTVMASNWAEKQTTFYAGIPPAEVGIYTIPAQEMPGDVYFVGTPEEVAGYEALKMHIEMTPVSDSSDENGTVIRLALGQELNVVGTVEKAVCNHDFVPVENADDSAYLCVKCGVKSEIPF